MPRFVALPTRGVRNLQAGGPDAYGNQAERAVSPGGGTPCRHCLRNIPKGADMLVLAHRPFNGAHPYAETGPIFLCAEHCEQGGGAALPEIFAETPDLLIKGYGENDRIVYGTGCVVPTQNLPDQISDIFARSDVAYIHIRSARNNCYQARVERD